ANYMLQFPVRRHRRWLYLALVLNFGCLAYFKYRVFLATTAGLNLFTGDIIIPLGISFYVFQLSAFLIDINRGRAQPCTSLARFAFFKLFFGQLVAGPIMRWQKLGPQVNRLFDGKPPLRGHRLAGLGLGLCLLGLTKKVVLADSLAPFVDAIFYDGPKDAAAAWLGSWLFAFQIYFDFSGYSDIAFVLGLIFGIIVSRNFDTPFCATDIQQLWQRWHITLTALLRDSGSAIWQRSDTPIGCQSLSQQGGSKPRCPTLESKRSALIGAIRATLEAAGLQFVDLDKRILTKVGVDGAPSRIRPQLGGRS